MCFFEKSISQEKIFDGKVFKILKDQVQLSNGKTAMREIVLHNGGVCVIPIHNGYVYMVRQFRKGAEKVLLEFPAGKLEQNEDHYDAGLRELSEEIGAKPGVYLYAGEMYPTPAYCSEKIHFYIADSLEFFEQNLDDDELLEVKKIKIEDLYEKVINNKISDAKTIIGTYKLMNYLKNN